MSSLLWHVSRRVCRAPAGAMVDDRERPERQSDLNFILSHVTVGLLVFRFLSSTVRRLQAQAPQGAEETKDGPDT